MIDWNDNAKAAVNAYNEWALENDLGIHTFFEHLTNNGHTQQKTVADVVDAHPLGWCDIPNRYDGEVDGVELVLWSKVHGGFEQGCDGYDEDVYYKVCTRSEFEAYVKEQEGEKWTHVYTDDTGTDIRCRLLAEHGEWAWIEDAGTVDTISRSWLKPIKPTISESEMMQRIKYRAISIDDDDEFGSKVRAWLDEYEII